MHGLSLYRTYELTYPYLVFEEIEPYVRQLNWKVSNVQTGILEYESPFKSEEYIIIDGDSFFELLKENRDVPWIWGVLSGFPKDVPEDIIRQTPIVDIESEQPYLKNKLHHIEPQAVLEIVAFDGIDTYVMFDDDELSDILKKAFPQAENLEKYVFTE